MRSALNVRIPFFRPVWRRLVITGACVAWALIETWAGSWAWAILMGGIGGYLAWEFFVVFNPEQYADEDPT